MHGAELAGSGGSGLLFKESQRFSQWWIWLLLLFVNGLIIYGTVAQVAGGTPFGEKPASDVLLIAVMIFVLLLTLLFYSMQLRTEVRDDGLHVQFFPIHRKPRIYTWDSMAKCYVRKYEPLLEYGGWGIRFGLFGRGAAFNVSGCHG